jgi:ribosomal protein S18 acetylase RimI-like enzyme
MSNVVYAREHELSSDEALVVYRDSTLGERRPVDDPAILAEMLRHAQLIVTARANGRLIGLARTLTDFSYVGYLADLAVVAEYQRQGIGRALIEETRRHMGPRSLIVLLAAPAAVEYYPRVGFTRHESAWILRAGDTLRE